MFLCRCARTQSDLGHCRVPPEAQGLLPHNICLRIFSFLSLQERTQVSYFCQRWNNFCKDSIFWREVDFSFCSTSQQLTDETVRAVTSYSMGIQSMNLSGDHCEPIIDEALGHVHAHASAYRDWTTVQLDWPADSNASLGGLSLIARNCSLLKDLNVDKCLGITDKGIKYIARRCSELTVLSVARCQKTNDLIYQCTQNIFHCLQSVAMTEVFAN